jgi:hypothetical protein
VGPVVVVSGALHVVESSGAITQSQIHYLFWIEDAKVKRAQSYPRREDAMAAAEAARRAAPG